VFSLHGGKDMRKRIRHLATLICGFFVAVPLLVGCGKQEILPTSISVTSEDTDSTIQVGQTLQLTASVLPEDAENKAIRWESNNNELASISETGLVTALSPAGDGVVLKAFSEADENIKGEFTLYIDPRTPNSLEVTSEGGITTLEINETLQLTATPTPEDANPNVTWSSSDEEVATISQNGLVTAVKYTYDGITITATSTSMAQEPIEGSITLYINADKTDISATRNLDVGTEVIIEGIVSGFIYTGQSTPYITGMYVADDTGCIYVYGENQAKSVSLYNEVVVKGSKAYYIPQTDSGSAAAMNYRGALQLIDPVILKNNGGTHDIPSSAITETNTLSTISDIPLTTDITGNLYRIDGRISRVEGTGFTNYYLQDLNRVDSLLVYTQCNGKDFAFLDAYDGKAVSILINVILAKPGVNAWRIYPTTVVEEITITDAQELAYGLERAKADISDSFADTVTITFNKVDVALSDMTRAISSTDPNISIVENADSYSITITVNPLENERDATISIAVSYHGLSDSTTKTIHIVGKPVYTAITLHEAKSQVDGAVVTVEAVVVRLVYKSGTEVPMGAFIMDSTDSFFIYNNADYMSSLAEVTEGNLIAVSGTVTHFVSDATNAAANNYTGDFQIKDITLIYNDNGDNDIPFESAQSKTIQEIYNTTGSTNLSGTIFEVRGVITKTSSAYYSTYYVKDSTQTYSLNVYSQKNGSEFGWLDEFLNKEVTMLLGIQNAKLSASSLTWRVCPIQVC